MRRTLPITLLLALATPALAGDAWYPSRYGAEDTLGAINELSPQKVLEAARLVKTGRTYALGVETGRIRLVVIAAATLMTSAAVAISGVIGWIGLVIPHFARLIVGPDFSRLLPTAVLLGAAFLVAVDTLARTMASIEIPLGVLTAFVGTPVFIWLLAATRRNWT